MADDKSEETNPDAHSEVIETPPEPEEDAESPAQQATTDDPLAAAQNQVAGLKDQALRAQAEMENVRRRAARDVEHAHKFALDKFAADLLPVIDSLEKALEATAASGADGVDALVEGVELSLKLFLSSCEKAGISQLDPLGEPFNPEEHEAMAMVPNPDAEPNSVMEVMQKGYALNGRLVRAAKVIVVKAQDN
ncbi:MAG: nucleotide exchange factor GrpE [Gammaproteobacteria bacterium]|nr:nucleotide exchange factor GrpE [Gammaproteobacteria bacterium]